MLYLADKIDTQVFGEVVKPSRSRKNVEGARHQTHIFLK